MAVERTIVTGRHDLHYSKAAGPSSTLFHASMTAKSSTRWRGYPLALLGMTVTLASTAAPQRVAPQRRADIVYEASITELQAAMTSGRTTSVELVDAYVARINAYDHNGPALNAIVRLNPRARADAAAL